MTQNNEPNEPVEKIERFFVPNELNLLFRVADREPVEDWFVYVETMLSISRERFELDNEQNEENPAFFDITLESETFPAGHYYALYLRLKGRPDDQTLIDIILRLNEFAGQKVHETRDIFFLEASPNWLFSGSQGQLIGGGPGGIPVKTTTASTRYSMQTPKVNENTITTNQSVATPTVNVVILDTVHSESVLEDAYTDFGGQPLLQSLKSNLTLTYASPQAKHTGRSGTTNYQGILVSIPSDQQNQNGYAHEQDYPVPDHGLFIAGLVHNIAPSAQIYLVEVLNRFGAGSLKGLEQALRSLAYGRILPKSNDPLVVNMSLTVGFSGSSQPNIAGLSPNMSLLWLAIQNVKQAFSNVIFLAAAGNDRQGAVLPSARFPAALTDVIGVGALDKNQNDAIYSSAADVPAEDGLVTFGGDARKYYGNVTTYAGFVRLKTSLGNPMYETTQGGLLSIYIGEFPQPLTIRADGVVMTWSYQPSPDGWGRWSGTSFATGVMSGVFAENASRNIPLSNVKTVLEQAGGKLPGSPTVVQAVQP